MSYVLQPQWIHTHHNVCKWHVASFCVHISNFVINAIQSFASNFEFLVICLLLFLLCSIFYCFTLSFSHFTLFVFYALVSLHDIGAQCATIQCCVIQALIVHYVQTLIAHIFLIFTIGVLHSMHLKIEFGCSQYVSCVCFWLFNLHLLCFIFHHCWCEWKGTWSNNIEGIWDNNVVIFSFLKFYPISFILSYNFENYIIRCTRNNKKPLKKTSVIYDESIKKCSTLKVKLKRGSS